jgi:hypothetical protein
MTPGEGLSADCRDLFRQSLLLGLCRLHFQRPRLGGAREGREGKEPVFKFGAVITPRASYPSSEPIDAIVRLAVGRTWPEVPDAGGPAFRP